MLLLASFLAAIRSSDMGSIQDGRDAEATIGVLQTQVAELQTQVATVPPKSTATPTPLPTVATEPQTLSNEWELLYYHAIEKESSTAILGEARNASDQRIGAPHLALTLLDAEGNILDTVYARPAIVALDPGDVMPFEADVTTVERSEWQLATITACEWGPQLYIEGEYGTSSALVLQDVEEHEKSDERLTIEGTVLNNGLTPIDEVHIKALVYLPDGRFAGTTTTWIDASIPSGKTARFHIDDGIRGVPAFSVPGIGSDYSYRLWVGTEPLGGSAYGDC